MSKAPEEIPSAHWADRTAEELIEKHQGKQRYVCASGISPSGVVHIGNFREVITVDFVVRSLKDRGKEVRFIYSWDDYDAFRKVPANLPEQEMLSKNLRKPISEVPDPFKEFPSYAGHHEKTFEKEITQLGIQPDYIYQNEPYRAGKYADGIATAIAHEKEIASILNKSRTEPLPDDWTCISIFCKVCGRDTTKVKKFVAPSTFEYTCKPCKQDLQVDFRKEGGVKLLWRVDWPMRWATENVDFEPGGKDHSSQGGSYDTGCEIIRAIWKKEPPHYVQYDFVLAKGIGAKLSSSSGNLITLGEALEIYEPPVVRWIFASRKPNLDFTIAFDLDVMKAYDDFDRCERYAFGIEPGEDKKVNYERRIYELSLVTPRKGAYGKLPAQFPFRHLCNILQIHQGDLDRTEAHYQKEIKTDADKARFRSRAARAWKWITTFAPEEFKFTVRSESTPATKSKFPDAIRDLVKLLQEGSLETKSEEEAASQVYQILKTHNLDSKAFFQDVYGILVGKPNGPKLASFLVAIGTARSATLLQRAI